jgi:DNA mismatch repair ATPase MutS
MAATWLLDLSVPVWVVPVVLQIILNFAVASETTRVFNAVSATEGAFLRYGAMLALLEGITADAPLVAELRGRVTLEKRRPSVAMKEFRTTVGWFDLRHNGLVHPFVNAVTSWDIHCVLRLEAWQRSAGHAARDWFAALGELEALSSIAGLAHDEPEYCFAEIASEPTFEAVELGHPLLEPGARVTNDVGLPRAGTALLVTGSNMSGKSTLLRAMGLAAVMGLAGGPVCARRFRVGEVAVHTSIKVSDSLGSGVSHFLAELRKLKAVVVATESDRPVLFLLDEILHGTNSRERQIGARWVFRELLERGALGAVSTHDMGLVELPPPLVERMQLVHFRENVQGGQMTFDYQLREGPVTSGNALQLMRILGLEVPLE